MTNETKNQYTLSLDEEVLGRIVLEAQLVTLEDLVRCLSILQTETESGLNPPPLMDILIEEKLISGRQRRILEDQIADFLKRRRGQKVWNRSLMSYLDVNGEAADGDSQEIEEPQESSNDEDSAEHGVYIKLQGEKEYVPVTAKEKKDDKPQAASTPTFGRERRFQSVADMLRNAPKPVTKSDEPKEEEPPVPPAAPRPAASNKPFMSISEMLKNSREASQQSEQKPEQSGQKAFKPLQPKPGARRGFRPSYQRNQGDDDDVEVAADDIRDELGISKKSDEELEEETALQMRRFVEMLIPGRKFQEVLRYVYENKIRKIDPQKACQATRLAPRELNAVLNHWHQIGLVRQVGANPNVFVPQPTQRKKIQQFMEYWASKKWHSRLLAMLLEQEQK